MFRQLSQRVKQELTESAWPVPSLGSAQAEAFTKVEQEFRACDRVQFTRNNYRAARLNGHTANVVAVDTQCSSLMIERDDGRREILDLAHFADRHIRPDWVRIIHSAQGATAERVVAHLESFRTNTVDTRAAYVAISRARSSAALYTDSRADLLTALGRWDGTQVGALDEALTRGGPGAAIDGRGPHTLQL